MQVNEGAAGDNWEQHWSEYSVSAQYNPAQNFRREVITALIAEGQSDKEAFKLLDIGSGQGDLLSCLEESFPSAELSGVELSQSGIDFAQKRVKRAKFLKQDLLEPFEGDEEWTHRAEVAVCSEVLEHIEEPEVLLKNVNQLLANNCQLVVTVPGGPRTPFDKHIGHRRHYDMKSLTQLLEKSGYNVKSAQALGFPFFNLYKMVIMLRGQRLIEDVSGEKNQEKGVSSLALFVMKVFGFLFNFNFNFLPLGWQIVAVAEKRENE